MKNEQGTNKSRIILIILGMSMILASIILNYKQQTSANNYSAKQNIVSEKNILVYSKETCIYCQMAKKLLDEKSLPYEVIDLSNNRDLHLKMIEKTGQNTVPYIFINDELIGGYSDLKKLDDQGQL